MTFRRTVHLWLAVVALLFCASGLGWQEQDFARRKVPAHTFSLPAGVPDLGARTVIGQPRPYYFREKDTLLDIARYFDLGYNELGDAYPDMDPWLPPQGQRAVIPTVWVLPALPSYEGLVVNIPEMRLYYFPDAGRDAVGRTVLTFPTGLGREDWPTPEAKFRVRGKTTNPTWVIPDSIKKERIADKGWTENFIPGGDPENPLGSHRIELTLPLYTIHGTNNPWAVGRLVTHGCIRLYPEDIEALFRLVEPGIRGQFVYQPVKVGVRGRRVFVEVHRDIYGLAGDLDAEAARRLADAGLSAFVDRSRVFLAVEARSGVPVDVTREFRDAGDLAELQGSGREGWAEVKED